MRLFFQGELSTTLTAILAVTIATAVGWYYSRETRSLAMPHRWLLPALRGFAIALVILMLAGPTIEYRRELGKVSTINVFVDASESMKFSDAIGGQLPAGVSGQPASEVNQATAKRPTRFDRAVGLLLATTEPSETAIDKTASPVQGWLESVKSTHRVKLFLMGGESTEQIYDSASPDPAPLSITSNDLGLDASRTNLSDTLRNRLLGAGSESLVVDAEEQTTPSNDQSQGSSEQAIVVLSDGQHNSGSSPEEASRRFGDVAIPLFTIGFGQQSEPTDLAILDIEAPTLVASSGRASGTLSIKDLGTEGTKYRVRIASGDKTVWERTLTTENQANRRVAYDFPVAELVANLRSKDSGAFERSKVAIPLQISIEPTDGEYDLSNNSLDYRLSASTRTRRMLIVDSRSRWETRYIRNVFDRDPTWSVDTIMLWPDRSSLTAIDEEQPAFPDEQKDLAAFDIIVWGDVDPTALTTDQLALVRGFVAQGGGIVFIDGERDHLATMTDSPIGDLIPVSFTGNRRISSPMRLALTTTGAQRAAMNLLMGDDAAAAENQVAWGALQPPTSIRQVEPLAGAEVWLEGKDSSTDKGSPILVTRLFGGGQVVYLAMDQSWRWRYRVADLYHARFWNQLIEAIMQRPFDVRDEYVALSTGAAQYRAGERATIRVQLRDASGNPATDAVVDAVAKREGAVEPMVVPLRLVDASRGIYQGESAPLELGNYVTSVRAAGYSSSEAVTSSFLVSPPPNRETLRLSQNVSLLTAMADASGGLYADESQAQRVWDAIKPLSDGSIEVKKLALAQSFVWFFAVLVLLALEWWLRKKVGLV
jgi:uncharacterized membrane protein